MSQDDNSLATLLLARRYSAEPYNALSDWPLQTTYPSIDYDWRPKTEYVAGHYQTVHCGLLGSRLEWIPGYWRRAW